MTEHVHTCPTCKKGTAGEGHMCIPLDASDKKCSWCGAVIPNERHLCNQKVKELSYICNSCGRTAVSAEHLCDPREIT